MTSRWLALVLLVAMGCGDDDVQPRAEQEGHTESAEPDPAAHHAEPPEAETAPRPAIRVTRLEGEVTVDGETASAGTGVTSGALVVTGEGASAVLDRAGGGRIELGPGTTMILGGAADLEAIVARGNVRGLLSPTGNSARPPLRIGTPAVSVEIGGSGDVWVHVDPDGRTWVATLSGRATVDRGGLDDGGRPVRRDVVAGRALVVDDGLPEETLDGPAREQDASAAAREALGEARAATPDALGARLTEASRALEDVLGRLETEAREGERLAERHRAAAEASAEKGRAVQRELVAHSQRVLRLRAAGRSRWERARALAELLRLAGTEPEPDPAAQRQRVLRSLGIEPSG